MMLYLIFIHAITVGEFFSLFLYSFFIFGPLQSLGDIINTYREAEVSLNNFENILALPQEPKPLNPVALGQIQTLEFKDVGFLHQSSNTNAIKGISFKTKTGDTIAFVGPSGAGKTTLVKLLVGLYPPKTGTILYNNIDRERINFDELRERIGFVTQDTQLFSGTIKENLLFVNPHATDGECFDVLEKAACQNLLARADKGIDTMIGEGGVKVSGGESKGFLLPVRCLESPIFLFSMKPHRPSIP